MQKKKSGAILEILKKTACLQNTVKFSAFIPWNSHNMLSARQLQNNA
jgi:hypothetical protein